MLNIKTQKRFENKNKQKTLIFNRTRAHIRDYYNPLFMQQPDRRFTIRGVKFDVFIFQLMKKVFFLT